MVACNTALFAAIRYPTGEPQPDWGSHLLRFLTSGHGRPEDNISQQLDTSGDLTSAAVKALQRMASDDYAEEQQQQQAEDERIADEPPSR